MRAPSYREHAFECLQLANTSSEPETKAVLIDMAHAWVRLAELAKFSRRKTHGHLTLVSDSTRETA